MKLSVLLRVAGEIVSAGPSFKPEDPLDGCIRESHRPSAMSKAIERGSRREAAQRLITAQRLGAQVACGVLALGLLTQCASEPPPPAATPDPPPVAAPEPSPAPAPVETAAASEPAPEPKTPPAPAPEPEPAAPTRPAGEIMTEGDTDFLFDDSASALKEAVRQKCEGEAAEGSDPKALADCRQKERDKFTGDVLSFQAASEDGPVTLIVYRRKGSRLDEVYRAPVVLKDQSPTTVLVSPKGGKGARPFLYAQREFTVQVPDNYSLVIEDPTLGKLVYRAKVGVVAR